MEHQWAIPDINHVGEGDRAQVGRHVVIHILAQIQETLVDTEEILCFLGVRYDAFRESDTALIVRGEFEMIASGYLEIGFEI